MLNVTTRREKKSYIMSFVDCFSLRKAVKREGKGGSACNLNGINRDCNFGQSFADLGRRR